MSRLRALCHSFHEHSRRVFARQRVELVVAVFLAGGCMTGCTRVSDGESFEKKAEWAASAFPAPVITQEELRGLVGGHLLVDTRTEEEYAVSHLPGAMNWPNYQSADLPEAVRNHAAEGGRVVFYCSIGYRSGEAAVRAADVLGPEARVFNLRGGIFQWANEGGALEGGTRVHGYDEKWGKLLRPGLKTLEPVSND